MKITRNNLLALLAIVVLYSLGACSERGRQTATSTEVPAEPKERGGSTEQSVSVAQTEPADQDEPDVSYTLVTSTGAEGLVFLGSGGEIDGISNPTLFARPGDAVEITLINGDGIQHDLTISELNVTTGQIENKDLERTVKFTVDEAGEYIYDCAVPGHHQAGMFGTLFVGEEGAFGAVGEDIIRHPADVPQPLDRRQPQTVSLELEAVEVTGQLADGTTYDYFTFNGAVPGPMLRVRLGDTVELKLTNAADSKFSHSIDLHAVNGPGGGHAYTETPPGVESVFTFKPLATGIYVYHCATPSVPHHITNGMYGLILVEPEEGLPPVDREYYVMQGELYTEQEYGTSGHLDFSAEKMSRETPEYFIFNGAAGALTQEGNTLTANTGETVRIFFGVGGPNKTSSFHVIGEIFDRVFTFGSLTSEPLTNVQTVTVPPGGATMVEFQVDVPGTYLLVDHALSRAERGLAGYLIVEGEPIQPDIFYQGPANP